jgi:probable F420-dependent oxidoreductase
VKLDVMQVGTRIEDAAEIARRAEDAGFDGLWFIESTVTPFLPLAVAATATSRIELGTAISLAFVRSPMVTAQCAWELQRASHGRFILGLGTQVKAHNERRFSVPFESPQQKLREQVLALNAIYAGFAGAPLDFHGDFYTFDLLPEFFNPGPMDYPAPPTYLAAMNPSAYRMSGEVADGVHIHPLHSARFLAEAALPAMSEGLARSDRSLADFTVSAQVLVVVGQGEERAQMENYVRGQIAFYGSTRTYRAPLELHGYGELNTELHELQAAGDRRGMMAAIPDELIEVFAVVGDTWEEVAAKARERYQGVCDRISFYTTPPLDDPSIGKVVSAFTA